MWCSQLERERDVVGQLEAIYALRLRPSSRSVQCLASCLDNPKLFWRVRAEAAAAVAQLSPQSEPNAGVQTLLAFFSARFLDPLSGLPKPCVAFCERADFCLRQAIPSALSSARSPEGWSPSGVVELVVSLLKNCGGGEESGWLLALLQAAGRLRPSPRDKTIFGKVVKQIYRWLQYDSLVPSHGCEVTCAAIRSLCQLSLHPLCHTRSPQGHPLLSVLASAARTLGTGKVGVRLAALQGRLYLHCHTQGMPHALKCLVEMVAGEPSPWGQHIHNSIASESSLGTDAGIPSDVLQGLLTLQCDADSWHHCKLRYQSYALLQAIANRPLKVGGGKGMGEAGGKEGGAGAITVRIPLLRPTPEASGRSGGIEGGSALAAGTDQGSGSPPCEKVVVTLRLPKWDSVGLLPPTAAEEAPPPVVSMEVRVIDFEGEGMEGEERVEGGVETAVEMEVGVEAGRGEGPPSLQLLFPRGEKRGGEGEGEGVKRVSKKRRLSDGGGRVGKEVPEGEEGRKRAKVEVKLEERGEDGSGWEVPLRDHLDVKVEGETRLGEEEEMGMEAGREDGEVGDEEGGRAIEAGLSGERSEEVEGNGRLGAESGMKDESLTFLPIELGRAESEEGEIRAMEVGLIERENGGRESLEDGERGE